MVWETSGREQLPKFSGRMNLPPPIIKAAYNEQQKQKLEVAENSTHNIMLEVCNHLRKIVAEEPSKIELDEEGNEIASVAVTVDGAWQKRGHTSKIGVVFVISVRTGEILDYEVKSLYCHVCVAKNAMEKNSEEYKQRKAAHEKDCSINHEGLSGSMEAVAAVDIFKEKLINERGSSSW